MKEEEELEISDDENSETDVEDLISSTLTPIKFVREQVELDNSKFVKEFLNSNVKKYNLSPRNPEAKEKVNHAHYMVSRQTFSDYLLQIEYYFNR